MPASSKKEDAAKKFVTWATCKEYIQLVAEDEGWVAVPPGTRTRPMRTPSIMKAAPFANFVLKAIESADPKNRPRTRPYVGVQFVAIPEFQAIGTQVGQTIAAALTGQMKSSRR